MGNVERCDTTLPTNEMMFYVRRDPRSGPEAAHGPRRPPVLRPPDPAPVLRRRPERERERRAPVLPARLPGGDGEGDGAGDATGGDLGDGADRRGDGDNPLSRTHRLVHEIGRA